MQDSAPKPPPSPRSQVIFLILAMAFGIFFIWIGYPGVRDAWRLRNSQAVADAEVVETRISYGQHGIPDYDVLYRFSAPGHSGWFTRSERPTGRSNLWSTVSLDVWERARASGRIPVKYVPQDPSVNCPLGREGQGIADSATGLAIGAVALLFGFVGLAVRAIRWMSPLAPSPLSPPRPAPRDS